MGRVDRKEGDGKGETGREATGQGATKRRATKRWGEGERGGDGEAGLLAARR